MLLPAKSISDSGQCFVPQRQRCLGMVFRSSQIHRGLQSPSLLSRTQCTGKNMASRSSARYPQSIFHNPRRTPLRSDFDISQHTEESISSYGLSASISIKHHVALFMQCCIADEIKIEKASEKVYVAQEIPKEFISPLEEDEKGS
jgi:hypothetical protein